MSSFDHFLVSLGSFVVVVVLQFTVIVFYGRSNLLGVMQSYEKQNSHSFLCGEIPFMIMFPTTDTSFYIYHVLIT